MFDTRYISRDFSQAAAQYDNYALLQQKVLCGLVAQMMPHLSSQATVLDAGCGTGQLARELKDNPVIQLDIAHAMCLKASHNKMPVIEGTVQSLPFADATFDAVFSSLVLQWVPDWQHGLQEMRRVLKPGGVLAISTFGPSTLKELKDSFAATDRYSHISSFLPRDAFDKSETVTEYYSDLFAIMRHLKNIGARNKLLGRRKSLMTPAQMQRVARRYEERFGTASGLPVTWEILSSVTKI